MNKRTAIRSCKIVIISRKIRVTVLGRKVICDLTNKLMDLVILMMNKAMVDNICSAL